MAVHWVPDAAEVVIHQQLFGQEVVNTLWATKSPGSPFTLTDLSDLAAAVAGSWIGGVLQNQSSSLQFLNVTVTDKSGPGGLQAIDFAGGPFSGIVTSTSLPGGSAASFKFATGRTGRSYRGRMFIAGLPESKVTGNQFNSDWALAVRSALNTLISDVLTAGWTPVVVSRTAAGVVRTTPVTTPIIIADFVNRDIDSQRRRLNGRGI